jgi:RNA polymerase sigma-70 factor (ECF subfamily)
MSQCVPETLLQGTIQDALENAGYMAKQEPFLSTKFRGRHITGMARPIQVDEPVDQEWDAGAVRLASGGVGETRFIQMPKPLTRLSPRPHEAVPPAKLELPPGPADPAICKLSGGVSGEAHETHSFPKVFSAANPVASRDNVVAADHRLRGERGLLAMEDDQLEPTGQPIPPALLHVVGGHPSPAHTPKPPPGIAERTGLPAASHEVSAVSGALEGMDDLQLVSAAQSGKAEAFDTLMLRHTSKLYGLVFHMSNSHEDTDDLLQEIWAKVYRSLQSFRGASRFSTWVHSIAVNMTLNFLKKRNRRSPVSLNAAPEGSDATLAELPGIDAEIEDALVCNQTPRTDANRGELQRLLSDALDQLTPEHRAVVTMFDVQGMAHAEIAKVMGISEGTVRSRLFYAHRQLQSYLSDVASDFLQSPKKNAL